jgi:hypothetical protein
MKNKETDLIQTWMREAGLEQPSTNLKYQILKKIERNPMEYQPVIPPIFWKIMGFVVSGVLLYALFIPSEEGGTSSWWQHYHPLYKVDIDFNLYYTSPHLTYALLIFSLYVYLFPILLRWWNNKLVS